MIKFKNYYNIPKGFTGICKLLEDNSVNYFKDGFFHREDGPACEYPSGNKFWYINNFLHREDGPAIEYEYGIKSWHYKNKIYGRNNDFTNETWKEKIEELKREEDLKIFI